MPKDLSHIALRVTEHEQANQVRVTNGLDWASATADQIRMSLTEVTSVEDLVAIRSRVLSDEQAAQNQHAKTITATEAMADDIVGMIDQAILTFGPNFGHPVYTRAEVEAWSTTSPEYTRLASSWAGNVNRTPKVADYGTTVTTTERDLGLKDESGYIKVQAVLWAADGTAARKTKVTTMLNSMRQIGVGITKPDDVFAKNTDGSSPMQHRLVLGWAVTNLCQAASIVGYRDPGFDRFLRSVAWPLLNWTNSTNWQASFADSQLAIAVYLKDINMYNEAKAYFHERLAQQIFHALWDGGYVQPTHNEDGQNGPLHAPPGTPDAAKTVATWGGLGGYPQVTTNMKAEYPPGTPFPNGTHSERRRDLGHVSMALGAWMHAARTILAQDDTLEQEAYDRIWAGYDYNSGRVLSYAQTGKIPEPVTTKGDGGGSRFQGYYGARKLFGADTPATVSTMLTRTEVAGYPASGANHLVAEAFADAL